MSPEYVGESTYNNPLYGSIRETPFLIVGGPVEERRSIFEILEGISGPYCIYYGCTALEAELIKYMENSFLATKVAFTNEFYEIVHRFGADWHTVREGWLLDERVGRAFSAVFASQRGFGGRCLPKDLRAIVTASRDAGYNPSLLVEVLGSNARHRGEDPPPFDRPQPAK
jgi:UDPglucose 6-dehydrogenase